MQAFVPVKKIEFGKTDGKKEARDPKFESIFYDGDGYFSDLNTDPSKYIVYGRKGTGKTLLVQYFLKQKEKEEHTYTKLISTDRFAEAKLNHFDYANLQPEETEIFWKFVILKELSTIVLEHERGFLNQKLVKKLSSVDGQLSLQLSEFVEESSSQVGANAKINNAGISAGISDRVKSTYHQGKYFQKLDELHSSLVEVLKKSRNTYFLAFDDLDELKTDVLHGLSAKDRIKKLASLLVDFVMALESTNDMLYEIDSKSRVLTTLRKDVVDQMERLGSNINKPLTDSGVELNWLAPIVNKAPEKSSLGKLIIHKVVGSVEAYENVDQTTLFRAIFPRTKKGSPFDWIVKRGFGRPRDIISFLNIYKKQFPEEFTIRMTGLKQVQGAYSTWFYRELQNEMHILENADSMQNTLMLIKKHHKISFMIEDLENCLSEFPSEFTGINDLGQDIRSLYDLGVLANSDLKRDDDRDRKPIMEYAYRNGENFANFATLFVVHPAIRNYLSLPN